MPLSLPSAMGLSAGIDAGSGLVNSFLNLIGQNSAFEKQVKASKDLFNYQWEKAYSPKAQVNNLAAAGLNPAAAMGNTSPVMSSAGQMTMPSPPNYNFGIGTQSLSDIANLLVGSAQAKKVGVDTKVSENAAEGAALDNERKRMENDFMSRFGLEKSATELAQAYANLENTYSDSALKQVQQAKEKALSEVNEKQRDILSKELDNKDTEIRLRNQKTQEEIKTEKSAQTANYASAANQSASAEQTKIFNKIYNDKRYQHSLITEAVSAGRKAVSEEAISRSQAKQMEYLVEQAAYANDMKEFTYWSNEVNKFVGTLGNAASQFYGAGALRELIKIRQVQQKPYVSNIGFKP